MAAHRLQAESQSTTMRLPSPQAWRTYGAVLIWAGLLVPSLAITTAYPIWLYTSGLRSASPFMADALEIGPLHRWVYALLVVIVLVTAATCRILRSPDESAHDLEGNWCRNARSYYHERRPLIMLAVVATIVACIADLVSWQWNLRGYIVAVLNGTVESQQGHKMLCCYRCQHHKMLCLPPLVTVPFVAVLYYPTAYLIAAGFLLALRKGIWARPRPLGSQPARPPRLPLPRFCAIWFATFLTAVFGIPTLAWFSFAVWLGPWYELPWP